jgi:fibronectin-binding autotransporter adhesin
MAIVEHVKTITVGNGTNSQLLQPSDWNATHLVTALDALAISGNTSGTLYTVSTGTFVLAGGNNVTLSQSQQSVTIIGPTIPAQSTQPAVASLNGSSGSITISGGNNITVGNNGSTITISAPNQSVQPIGTATLSVIGGSSVSGTSPSLVLSGGNNITLNETTGANGAITIQVSGVNTVAQSVQPAVGSLNGSSGTISISGGNNITVGNNNGTITISAFNQSVQPEGTISFSVSGLSSISGTGPSVIFSGGNNITLQQTTNGSTMTLGISAANQSIPAQSLTIVGNTVGQSTLTASSLYLSGGPNVTLSIINGSLVFSGGAGAAGNTGYISAGTTYGSLGTISFSNGSGVSFGINGQTLTASVSAQSVQPIGSATFSVSGLSSVSGTSPQVVFSGGNNITLQQTTGANGSMTLGINAPVNILNSFSISGNIGTTNSSAITGGGFVIAGGNNVTLSQSNNSISINAPSPAGATQSFGVSGSTYTASALSVVFSGGNNITLNQTTNAGSATIQISAFNQSVQPIGSASFSVSGLSQVTGTSPQVVFSGGNNITLQQTTAANGVMTLGISAPNQSIQPIGTQSFGLSGSTVSGTGLSYVITQAGIISLSQSSNGASATLTISASQSVQPIGTQSFSVSGASSLSGTGMQIVFSGGNNITLQQTTAGSNMTIGISGPSTFASSFVQQLDGSSGSLTLVAGNNISISNNASTISIINLLSSSATAVDVASISSAGTLSSRYALPDHQHRGIGGIQITGNTAGTTSPIYGLLTLSGGNNITLSQSTSAGGTTLAISAFNQSVQPAVGSLDGSSGTLTITAGANITVSNNASSIGIIGPTNILSSFSIGGNTGTTNSSAVTGGGFLIAGGSNITLSQSNNSISIHGNALAVAASNTTYTSGTVVFSGSQNITVSYNGVGQTISVYGPNNILNSFSISGNTGTTNSSNITGGGFVIAGGNNVTLSQSNNTISINAPSPAGVTQSYGVTNSTFTASVLSVVWSAGNNITLNQTSNAGSATIQVSGNPIATASFSVSGLSQITGTAPQVVFSGGTNISLNQTTGAGTMTLQINGPSNILNSFSIGGNTGTTNSSAITGGGFVIAGGNNITLSQSNNTISINAPSPAGATQSFGVSGSTFTASALSVVLSGGNNITLNQTTAGGSATIQVSAASQSVQPEGTQFLGVSGSQISGTGINYIFTQAGIINLSQSSNGSSATLTISASQSIQPEMPIGMSTYGNTAGSAGLMTGQLVLVGSQNITLSQSTVAGQSATLTLLGPANILNSFSVSGNTGTTNSSAITGGGFVLAGGNNITLNQSNNTISISAFNQSSQSHSVVFGGNTSNSSSMSFNTAISISGSNNITISGAAGAFNIVGPANILNSFSISGNTGTTNSSNITGGGFVLAATQNATLSQSNNSISIYGIPYVSRLIKPDHPADVTVMGTNIGLNSLSIQYLQVSSPLVFSAAKFYLSMSGTTFTSATTASVQMTISAGLYSMNATTLSLMASGNQTYGQTWTSGGGGISTLNNLNYFTVPLATTITKPGNYWLALQISSATTYTGASASLLGQPLAQTAGLQAAPFGSTAQVTRGFFPAQGVASYTSAGANANSIGVANITQTGLSYAQAAFAVELLNANIY